MKTLDIALLDLTRSFRSAFLLIFMFVIPLLMTGMFYLMFGNPSAQDGTGLTLPHTRVVIANLDRGSPTLTAGIDALSPGSSAQSLGEMIVQSLRSQQLAEWLDVSLAADETSARQAVDNQQAALAVIIPADFSASYADPLGKPDLQVYQDPASNVGAGIVKALLSQLTDQFSGIKIAMAALFAQTTPDGTQLELSGAGGLVAQYLSDLQVPGIDLVAVRPPAPDKQPAGGLTLIIGPVMGAMLIFFAFFTGGATAQSFLKEEEEGTLPRLFTTPTPLTGIIGGKMAAIGLTVLAQVSVLLAATRLIFGIQWGSLLPVILTAAGIIICATALGICVTSLLKSTRQGGLVYGGLMTISGMLGMMQVFTGSGSSSPLNIISLVVPQGWAVRGLILSLNGAGAGEAALNLLALLGWSAVLLMIGVLRFQKRYA